MTETQLRAFIQYLAALHFVDGKIKGVTVNYGPDDVVTGTIETLRHTSDTANASDVGAVTLLCKGKRHFVDLDLVESARVEHVDGTFKEFP
jgi:hypothetical protein